MTIISEILYEPMLCQLSLFFTCNYASGARSGARARDEQSKKYNSGGPRI